MKAGFKIVGLVLLAVVLLVAGSIAAIEFSRHYSRKRVARVVSSLPPGTAFATATGLLGNAAQTYTNQEEIVYWVEQAWKKNPKIIPTNSVLHTFGHIGPPFRYILVFTDPDVQKILHADWCDL